MLTTRTYRLDHDLGFAPNPFFGWCTLACCMPQIRQHAKIGDIVIGMAGKGGLGCIYPQLIYWMRVDQAMTFDEYWSDPRFVNKRPQMPGPKMRIVGDRTYRHEPGQADWQFDRSMHHLPGTTKATSRHADLDTKVDRLLVGKQFTYWGNSGPSVPADLMSLFPNPRGNKCPPAGPLLDQLHELSGVNDPRGHVGDPADWGNKRYFD
jgi:hypothetical protein